MVSTPQSTYLRERPDLFESFVNNVWMLKMVVGEKVELVEEISNVDAAEWVHLRKGKYAWEPEP